MIFLLTGLKVTLFGSNVKEKDDSKTEVLN